MATIREEGKPKPVTNTEVLEKAEVVEVCVLCGGEGHVGKDCVEEVCILCCARGHVMDQCGDITVVDNDSDLEKPAIRLMKLDDLLGVGKDGDKNVLLDETTITLQAVPTTTENRSYKHYEEEVDEKFLRKMTRMFEKTTPPDVIALFKERYCGLCCIKFSCDKFAKKHYEGRGHESLIKKKTFRNRPMFWQMVFHALISREPKGATEEEIFEYIIDTFSAHVSDNRQQVRADMVSTIRDMVERFKNVVNCNGVYRLRDRKPGEAPKPVPTGLVEKKYEEGASKDQMSIRSGYFDLKRQYDMKRQEKGDCINSSSRNKDFERRVLDRSRDLKCELERDRSQRRRREDRSRNERDRSRDSSLRKRYRERRRSRDRSPRRSGYRYQSRSSHVRESSPTGLRSRRPVEVETYHEIVKPEAAVICPNILGSNPVNSKCFPQSQHVVAGYPSYAYPTPTIMNMVTPGMAESLSALLSGIMTATQTQQALTPPPTPEEFSQ